MNISIITCTLNSISTLQRTIDSVLEQNHIEKELVFVDGGSTDGTIQVIEKLECRKKILTGITGGIAKAMNSGVAAASGDIFCHLHSDDYFLHRQVLTRVATHFENKNVAWVFGRILSDIEGGLYAETFRVPRYSHARLLRGNFVPHPAMFVRTSVFKEVGGFRDDLRFAMDYDFFLRLGRHYEPVALREALAVFRRHAGSTTQQNRLASFEEDHRVRLQYASRNPVDRLMHAARYVVRKRRLLAQLRAQPHAD